MIDPAVQRRVAECGKALALACVNTMSAGGSVNLPTTIAACARMAGNYLLRSFRQDLSAVPPGQAILSSKAGEETPALVQYCATALHSFGTTIAKDPPESMDEARARIRLGFLDSQVALEPAFTQLQEKHALDDAQMAKAAAAATAALVHKFSNHMNANVAFACAAYGITEGARMSPQVSRAHPSAKRER